MTSEIGSEEVLGRAIFDSKKAKKAAKGVIEPKIFRGKDGDHILSVDRMSLADRNHLKGIHDVERTNQTFHGWANVSNVHATSLKRTTLGVPTDENKWHAEIYLPVIGAEISAEDQDAHSLNLALGATWEEKPSAETGSNA